MGTATFNSQYNPDPYGLPTTELVHRALTSGIRAFDTSPYYGPAETLLGRALSTPTIRSSFPRQSYHLLTKVGRIASSSFDYSPPWVRASIHRSLTRLHTDYIDLVYCHDVEFVSPDQVLSAVRELRRIRDDGKIRYVGISGYPVKVLCEIAELVLRETGEPLDAVMSYANFTLQNTLLLSEGLPRLIAAGVDVVPNASPLGMGLLRRDGVPIGGMGDFHPAPDGLRCAVRKAGLWAEAQGEKLEVLAIRFALESWLLDASSVGALGPPLRAADADPGLLSVRNFGTGDRLGVSVMGVSNLDELNETLRVWRSIVDALEGRDVGDAKVMDKGIITPDDGVTDHVWSTRRRGRIVELFRGFQDVLGDEWVDYTWASPPVGFVNELPGDHVARLRSELARGDAGSQSMITPPLEAVDKPSDSPFDAL